MIHSAKGYEMPKGHNVVGRIDVTDHNGNRLEHIYITGPSRSGPEIQKDKETIYNRFQETHGKTSCYIFTNWLAGD